MPNLTCPAVPGSAGSIPRWQRLIQYNPLDGRALFATRQWGSNSKSFLSEDVVRLSVNIEYFDSLLPELPLLKRCHSAAIPISQAAPTTLYLCLISHPMANYSERSRDIFGTHIRLRSNFDHG